MSPRYKYFQPLSLEYTDKLTEGITGYTMPLPNLEIFDTHYDEPKKRAPTNPLLGTLRLLLPQLRTINYLRIGKEKKPNPTAFLASKLVEPEALALIFRKWVEVCYPESAHTALMPYCSPEQFCWSTVTAKDQEYWAPAWALALQLTQPRYQLGEHPPFKLLFGPGHSSNTVELVSWPPFRGRHDHRASIAVIISTQSDLDTRKINLHFKMKRWIVKQTEESGVRLKGKTTHCYVRRSRPWLGDYNLKDPNAFTSLEANYRKEEDDYVSQWKGQRILSILERLTVEVPAITDVLANPLDFLDTDHTDILIPARSYQKAGWGTGVPFADERSFLQQIETALPPSVSLTQPWKKLSISKETKSNLKQRFKPNPKIKRPSQGRLPEIDQSVKDFLKERIDGQMTLICCCTEEVQAALEKVTQHYFDNSLKLDFHPLQGLSDPVVEEKRNDRSIPNLQHIQGFGEQNRQVKPTPIIIEILAPDHPNYRGKIDPKPHLKSQLPKYNLIPQCILSTDVGNDPERRDMLDKSLYNRALSAILDAILPFDQNIPLSIIDSSNDEKNDSKDTVYAGFYVIRRNKKTASKSFSEAVLVCIYKNEISVLLPARSTEPLSMPDAICQLAHAQPKLKKPEQAVSDMLGQLSLTYDAKDIYLFAHAQNARQYWAWLQDSRFNPELPPTTKIHIIRIRDQSNHEVSAGHGLPTEQESFEKGAASFANEMFIPSTCNFQDAPFTQTVLSIAQKPVTNQLSRQMSRFQMWESEGYEKETDQNGKLIQRNGRSINKRDPQTGKCIPKLTSNNPTQVKNWKVPQPRAHNILATPSSENIELHHAITDELRSRHWWTPDECEYPLPLSLAKKLKEWAFNEDESAIS